MDKVLVVGSLNMDFAVYMDRRPQAGETVMARSMKLVPGGKGANQAYALGKLGANTAMIGAVGTYTFGQQMRRNLEQVSVNTDGIKKIAGVETGKAFIEIENSGQNSISVIAGANAAVDEKMVLEQEECFSQTDAVVMQLEIPMPIVEYAAGKACAKGVKVILNPAPGTKISESLLSKLYIIVPNETECEILTGIRITDQESKMRAAEKLLRAGVKNVILTIGSKGSCLVNSEGCVHVPAIPQKAVDTTAAGDVYCGALCVALSEGKSISDAMLFATAASSISVMRKGAQPSIPTREEVLDLIGKVK